MLRLAESFIARKAVGTWRSFISRRLPIAAKGTFRTRFRPRNTKRLTTDVRLADDVECREGGHTGSQTASACFLWRGACFSTLAPLKQRASTLIGVDRSQRQRVFFDLER